MKQVSDVLANRALWLHMLESGEYEQTTDFLYEDGAYCAIGLAAHALGRNVSNHSDDHYEAVEIEIGMHNDAVQLIYEMNDSDELSFSQIAAELQQNPDKYFKEVS